MFFNVTGAVGKTADFFHDISKANSTIFCLSETMYTSPNFKHGTLSNYNLHVIPATSKTRGRPEGGFILGWLHSIDNSVTVLKENQHSIFIKLNLGSITILIVFFYLPPDNQYSSRLKTLMEKVAQLGASFPNSILMGDSNAHLGTSNTVMGLSRNSKDARLDAKGKELLMRAEELDLQLGNGAINGDTQGELTFISHANAKARAGASVIDILLFSSSTYPLINSFQVLENCSPGHFPILTTLFMSTQAPKVQMSKTKIKIPQDPSKIAELKEEVESLLQMNSHSITNTVTKACENLALVKGPRPISSKPRWFDAECDTFKYQRAKALRRLRRLPPWNTAKRTLLLQQYQDAKQTYAEICDKKSQALEKKRETSILNTKDPTTFWKTVKGLRAPREIQKPNIRTEDWHRFYSHVFNPENQPNIQLPNFDNMKPCDILDAPFNTLEISHTIKNLKNQKAPGPDLIPNEIWKLFSPKSLEHLCTTFQTVYDTGIVPPSWCKVLVTPIYKKGEKDNPGNYRPISLLNTILKLFTTILTNRLNYWTESEGKISQYQAGFRKGKSTLDQIFVLTSLIQQHVNKGEKLYVCFVDLKQAFDSPNHALLWNVLQKEGVSGKLIRVLKSIYDQATARISSGGQTTDEIKIAKGVLQGESASPSLFNLLIEGLSRKYAWLQILGPHIAGIPVHHLLFADDLGIIATTPETLQDKINVAANFFQTTYLNVNLEKTKVIVFSPSGRTPKLLKFKWKKDTIEIVKEYIYLGVTFSSNGKFHAHATRAKTKGIGAAAALQSTLRKPRTFSLSLIQRLLTTILNSTSLYGAGIWGIPHADKTEIPQQQYLKSALGLPRSCANYFVRLETGIPHTLLQTAKLAYLFWRRILSAPENSLLSAAYRSLRTGLESEPNQNNNWCAQLRNLLVSVNMRWVWDKDDPTICNSNLTMFLSRLKDRLTKDDMEQALQSPTMPHYHSLVTASPAFHLIANLPRYVVTRIAQLRSNHNIVLNGRNWANLGAFTDTSCKYCGNRLSLFHLLTECPNGVTRRAQFFQSVTPSAVLDDCSTKLYPMAFYTHLHNYMTNTIKPFEHD